MNKIKMVLLDVALILVAMTTAKAHIFCSAFVTNRPGSNRGVWKDGRNVKNVGNGNTILNDLNFKRKGPNIGLVRMTAKDEQRQDTASNTLFDNEYQIGMHSPPTLKSLINSNASKQKEEENDIKEKEEDISKTIATRRIFLASTLLSTGITIGHTTTTPAAAYPTTTATQENLMYKTSPINKRSGITLFDAENDGYNVRFITYLSRFLLYFDQDCQTFWVRSASSIPRTATASEVDEYRYTQFASFAASVEVGLQEYEGVGGPCRLMDSLLKRYATPDVGDDGNKKGSNKKKKQLQPMKKEAKRQIALLFGLMEKYQPVEELTKLLASIDNATITNVYVQDPGTGYAPGYGSPLVTFPKPDAAAADDGSNNREENSETYEQATGRAILSWSGRILRVDLTERGAGYVGLKQPIVTISPPKILSEAQDNSTTVFKASTAKAKAYLFPSTSIKNRGRIERIELTDPGSGYTQNETIIVTIEPPATPVEKGGINATAIVIPELQVSDIEIINGGSGYVAEKPIRIKIEPPPITARVNMNDPLISSQTISTGFTLDPNEKLPYSKTKSSASNSKNRKEDDQEIVNDIVPTLIVDQEAKAGRKSDSGGCIGRACYDREVVAYGYPTAMNKKDSYTSFYSKKVNETMPSSLVAGGDNAVRAKSEGEDNLPSPPFWGGGSKSSSSQLLYLLPSGVGLQYDTSLGRYILTVDDDEDDSGNAYIDNSKRIKGAEGKFKGQKTLPLKGKPIDPDFGPRGRSPIEREKDLDIPTALRFCLSGALCSSGAHLLLTPIDVVKTKVQTKPEKYTGFLNAFGIVAEEDGLKAFVTGWEPTIVGFFVWGGTSYTLTEFFRRYLTSSLSGGGGVVAPSLEVPIILGSAAIAAVFGALVISPFEAVRIRSVAQPDFADNIFGVLKRMVSEEGVLSLFSIVPVYMAKEIPFGAAKFTVFALSTEYMYETFPAAREDLQLSLLVSVGGGILGGIAAAIVSNPADVTISEMKKAKTDMGPIEAARVLLDRAGIPALFKGLGLRLFFYSLLVSLQFLVYDSVRFALGIGADDLKLYLDVLGSALKDSNGGG